MYKSIFAVFMVAITSPSPSVADDRQAIYENALLQAGKLVSVLSVAQNNRLLRDQAVITAEAMKQLSFSEAEGRKQDKIGLPAGFDSPSLAAVPDILNRKAGDMVAIEQVPNDWFTGYLEKAEVEIHTIVKTLDAGEKTSIDKYLSHAQQAYDYLELMVKPPKS